MAGSICDVVFLSVCSLSAVFVFAFPGIESCVCVWMERIVCKFTTCEHEGSRGKPDFLEGELFISQFTDQRRVSI